MKAVFFDVGETLVDETRLWGERADAAGIPRFTFFGVLGALAGRGEHHTRVYEILGIDRPDGGAFLPVDLYPDALPCLLTLRDQGYAVGVAGNTTRAVACLGLDVDFVASSEEWGVEKPSPAFFARIADTVQRPTAEVAYVGDRVDNDVLPAVEAGMVAIHVRRGPWGYLQGGAERAHARIESLAELPEALRGL